MAATAAVRTALRGERAAVEAARSSALDRAAQGFESAVADASVTAAREKARIRARAASISTELAPGPLGAPWSEAASWRAESTSALDAASFVRVGRIQAPAVGDGGFPAPLILPLLGRGNLLLRSNGRGDAVRAALVGLASRALAGTGAGQLHVHVFDPGLRGVFAPFTPLRSVDNALFEQRSTVGELQQLLADRAADIQRVAEACGDSSVSIEQLRRRYGQPVESFHVVAVLDFPKGFDQASFGSLLTLLESGPRRGVSFLLQHDVEIAAADGIDRSALDKLCNVINIRDEGARWQGVPALDIAIDEAPRSALVQHVVGEVCERARRMTVPSLPLSEVMQLDALWQRTSADGISTVIGRAGQDPVVVSLGDAREQRHNILVTGAVGQGKSNLLSVMIHGFAAQYPPDELSMYLLDFKDGMTFYPLASSEASPEWLPNAAVIGVESDRQFGLSVLEYLLEEFERRARVIKPHGDSIAAYRRQVPDARMPRLLVVIDEFHVLFEGDDQIAARAAQLLEALSRRGRAYGIHLLLASQTISGIRALVTKEDGIFAQFPIRIALKNSAEESRTVLGADNSEAARLRYRGEAILNNDFGQLDGNRRLVIAAADDAAMASLRRRVWQRLPPGAVEPKVFNGGQPVTWRELVPQLRALRNRGQSGESRFAVLGQEVSVHTRLGGITIAPEAGRMVAVLGAGAAGSPGGGGDDSQVRPDTAGIGALDAAAVSLALQHPLGDARFTFLSLRPSAGRDQREPSLVPLLRDLGFLVDVVDRDMLIPTLHAIAATVTRQSSPVESHYVIAPGLDRAGSLTRVDESMSAPIDALRTILRDGPSAGVHLLAAWSSVRAYKAHVGYEDPVDGLLALRLDQRDIADLMGYTVEWQSPEHRGLLYDRTHAPRPTTIVPAAPLTEADRRMLARVDWDK